MFSCFQTIRFILLFVSIVIIFFCKCLFFWVYLYVVLKVAFLS